MTIPSDLPQSFAPLRDRVWTRMTVGESGASVFRIELSEETSVFLKSEPLDPLAELPGEIERLNWLTRMGFKAPRVIDAEQSADRVWLLMSAVPGEDLTHIDDPTQIARIFSQGLKRLHALDPAQCPFDHSIDARLALAEQRIRAGLVDETDFDEERQGWTATQVVDWLDRNRPAVGKPTVTHGDASSPNLLAEDGRFSGMIDVSRLGVADAWQDLALACRSVADYGEEHVAAFLSAYGVEWDEAQYRFYCTLDELF
jgi:aminoglycoside 3'-phosphotransferase II